MHKPKADWQIGLHDMFDDIPTYLKVVVVSIMFFARDDSRNTVFVFVFQIISLPALKC